MAQYGSDDITVAGFRQLFVQDVPLLDLRAPCEFAQGAFPNAFNLPLLNDAERHLVGKCYRESGQDAAVALGHELVAGEAREARLQTWLEFARANPGGALYCFRGGLRSQTVLQWLRECGINYPQIAGGYKALRRYLIDELAQAVGSLPLIVLGGRTGSGKTLLLQTLQSFVDLEDLAQHRGSSFGATTVPQPTNITFENALTIALLRLEPASEQPVFLEDEGRLIGRVSLPDVLHTALQCGPSIILEAPLEERIEISLEAYIIELQERYCENSGLAQGMRAFAAHHRDALQRISKRFGGVNMEVTLALFERALLQQGSQGRFDDYRPYISKLLTDYYDPMYDYQIARKQRPVLMQGNSADIRQWLASRAVGWLQQISGTAGAAAC